MVRLICKYQPELSARVPIRTYDYRTTKEVLGFVRIPVLRSGNLEEKAKNDSDGDTSGASALHCLKSRSFFAHL